MTLQNRVVLWVDDDEDDRLIARKALRSCRPDLPVTGLADGEELLKYLRREGDYACSQTHPPPGLVFLDLHMPRRSGLEILAEIRKDPRLQQIPVVIISTPGLEEEVEKARRLGANGSVDRPPSFRGLCRSVQDALDTWLGTDDWPAEPAHVRQRAS